jgi:Ni,Fe-hydrogenase I cytochrome b subunit
MASSLLHRSPGRSIDGRIHAFVAHLYVVVREDVMGRQTVVSTMLSGIRSFRP